MNSEQREPAMFRHAVQLWETMYQQAHGAAGVAGIFEGSLTQAYDASKLSRTHYTRLYRLLAEMGCIVIERKGRRDMPGRVVLRTRPTLDEYMKLYDSPLTNSTGSGIVALEQRIVQLEGRLPEIDIKQAFLEIEQRLSKLETGSDNG